VKINSWQKKWSGHGRTADYGSTGGGCPGGRMSAGHVSRWTSRPQAQRCVENSTSAAAAGLICDCRARRLFRAQSARVVDLHRETARVPPSRHLQQSYSLLFGIPSPTRSFIPGLKPSFSANPSHCSSPSFLLLKYSLRGFPRLFTVISEHICFLLLVFFLIYTF